MRLAPPLAAPLAALLVAAPAGAADLKIGYLDFQRVLNEVEEGKTAKASLKRDFDEKQKTIDKDKADFEKLQVDFQKQSVVMSEEARREKAMELERRLGEAQTRALGFQKEITEREREITRGIYDKTAALVREVAEAEGFTLIFERNDAGLLYGPAALDLTNEVIRKYNARHRPAAGKPAAGPEKKKEGKAEREKKAAPAKP
ncbi:MAG TPA: OmpH family outer membrane protein [Anaeromyxobacteraceae bacterium]|jgi:outer membrane protein